MGGRTHAPYRSQHQGFYDRYYAQQVGNGLTVYSGLPHQRGHGLGSILGGLIRGAMPTLKSVGKVVGKQALEAGMGVARDVAAGDSVKASLKRRAREGAVGLLGGAAIKRRRKSVPKTRSKRTTGRTKARKTTKRRQSDFFG